MKTQWIRLYFKTISGLGLLLVSLPLLATSSLYSDQQNQVMTMRLWVNHVYMSLSTQSQQLDEQLACLKSESQIAKCQQMEIDLQSWQFAYQQMRLLLAMSQPQSYHEPYRQKLIEESTQAKFWPYQFTLRIQHLFGQIITPFKNEVGHPAALNYLSSYEIEQVLSFRQMQMAEINKNWMESDLRLRAPNRGEDPSQLYWDFVRAQRSQYYEQARKNYFNLLGRYPFLVFVEKPALGEYPVKYHFYQAKLIQKRLLSQMLAQLWELKVKQEFANEEYLHLLAFNYLEESFLKQYQDLSDVNLGWKLLKKSFARLELRQDLTYLGGLVALGITCVVGPGKFLKVLALSKTLSTLGVGVCSLGAGLGFNYLFYDQSLNRFASSYQRLLSHPEASQIGLDLAELEDREFALLLDTLFLGVGTGVGQMATKLGPQAKTLLNRIKFIKD